MKKILLISDVHANLVALEAVLQKAGKVDLVIHAGDLVDYNPWPSEVLKIIRKLNLIAVMGNHDRDSATGNPIGYNPYAEASCLWTHTQLTHDERRYLLELPEKAEVVVENLRLFICHGSPYKLVDEYIFPLPITSKKYLASFFEVTKSDAVIMGHTHIPFIESFSDEYSSKYVINPGGAGQPRDGISSASYMIMEIDENNVEIDHKRVEYDIKKVADEIGRKRLPSFLGQRLFRGI